MANIIPIKVEYDLEVMKHTMKAVAEHLELARRITFYFDDKVVSEKAVPPGDFMTDDVCINDIVENYCNTQKGVFVDILKRHSDKVHLISKILDFTIETYGIMMPAHVVVEKGKYTVTVSSESGEDSFTGTFKANNFSEVLEKIRVFTSTLEGISDNLSTHINELASDKVKEWISWE